MGQSKAQHPIEAQLQRLAPFEWTNLETQSAWNTEILARLADDRDALRFLLDLVSSDPRRMALCEKDEFRFKIVLFDGLDRGFRLRLHAWRTGFEDCVHAHRFTYTARILSGGYQHSLWDAGGQELYPDGFERFRERRLPADDPFVVRHLEPGRFQRTLITSIRAGQTYTQDNSVLSSTITEPQTVSLFLRGPAVRRYSLQWHTDSRHIVWRGGEATAEGWRREKLAMNREDFDQVFAQLSDLSIV